VKKLALTLSALVLGLSLVAVQSGEAQLFQQQFTNTFGPLLGTSATPVYLTDANYVSATPSNSQFTHISATGSSGSSYMSVFVDGSGVLTMDRVGAGNAALVRAFPFPGPPTSLLVKFDFNVTSYRRGGGSTSGNYVNFNVGTTFDTAAGRPSGGFAKFGIGWYRSTGVDSFWYVNNINSGTAPGTGQFRSSQAITFAVNGSGGVLTYTAPGGGSETVADQTWDLWVGTSKEFDDQPVLDNTQTLSTFKLVNGGGSNTITFDNLLIDPLVATGVNGTPAVPQTMKLEQNYPNPFNPQSNVRYQISEISEVKLAVYDLLGREVAVLVNERKTPGSYEIRFDGMGLASGMYVYRLIAHPTDGGHAGSYVETRTMLLLR
jgi:hypothetical protein